MKIKMLPALRGDCFEIVLDNISRPRMIIVDGGEGKLCLFELKNDIEEWIKQFKAIDLIILTHIDSDHISGFLNLFNRDLISSDTLKEIWFNYGAKVNEYYHINGGKSLFFKNDTCETSAKQGKDLFQLLKDKKIQISAPILSGKDKKLDQYKIEVISPSKECLRRFVNSEEYLYGEQNESTETAGRKKDYDYEIEDFINKPFDESSVSITNASSIAILITKGEHQVLFLGDAKDSEIVHELKQRGYSQNNRLYLDFLKVSHHGSAHSTSDELIKIINCSNFIISSNWSNRPTKECLSRIIINCDHPVTFWCNYEPEENIFTKEEYAKYGMCFKYVGDSEIIIND